MKQLTVRQVDEELVRALRLRAALHGRSAEAEHREILRMVLLPATPRMSFEQFLTTMPDVGVDEDFGRIEGAIREIDP